METFYKVQGRSRQYYAQKNNQATKTLMMETEIIEQVLNWRESHPKMGSRPMYHSMINAGIEIPIGVNRFEKLLQIQGLTVGKVRRSGPYTSDGKGRENYPNLTNGLTLTDVNQLLVADITYFWLRARWYYIFTMKDAYSQRIVGLQPSKSMETSIAILCLNEAAKDRGANALAGCIHHTDNGSQYNAKVYKERLAKLGMRISRAEGCQQNGSAEQLNHIAKNMYLKNWVIDTEQELIEACREFKYLNNEQRAIAQLGYLTPVKFEKKLKSIPDKNRQIKTLHDFD